MNEKLYSTEPFALGYLNAKYDDPEYRIANGIYYIAKYRPLEIPRGQWFVGNYDHLTSFASFFMYGNGIVFDEEIAAAKIKEHPELARELNEIYEKMRPLDTAKLVYEESRSEHKLMCESRAGWGGGQYAWCVGHSNPDYLIRGGTRALRKKIGEYREINRDKSVFYDALELTVDAIELYASRYRKIALKNAESADPCEKNRLLKLAEALGRVPQNEPFDFYEACVSFWLVFSVDGYDSPGRFDQYMLDYYRKTDKEERMLVLENLWYQFQKYRTWNLCIGGSDGEWRDESNELSADILKTAAKLKFNTPNLTMRVHRNTPENLWAAAAESLATGTGLPAIYNDECVCPALEAVGIAREDAHDYCMNGCNQIDIFGKSNMGLEDGEVSLAKCLELAIFNGKCPILGKTVGQETGEFADFKSYDELFSAYKRQVEYISDLSCEMANITQKIVAATAPNPHRSKLFADCIEKGLDFKNGGTRYYNAQILAEGIADTADSLAAIRHFVFEEKKYTLAELKRALEENFENSEELYLDFKNYKKFGTDDPETNAVYKEVVEHFYSYLLTKKAYRGGTFGGGCSPFNRAAMYGGAIGALPNGKRKGSSLLADSIGAVPGCDTKGPTALLNSALACDQTLAKSGNVLQLKFTKSVFCKEEGKNAFVNLAKVYFAGKGQQLTVNVLSKDELLEAQKCPEKYRSLIVRVGGYSDYFTRLSPELQENVIKRTEMAL